MLFNSGDANCNLSIPLLLFLKMQLSPALASILVLLTNAWVTTADTVPCPNPAILGGDLVTIISGQTALRVSSAIVGAALQGSQATTPVDTAAKWLLQPVGLSLHPSGYVFKYVVLPAFRAHMNQSVTRVRAFNDIDLQVVTSDVSPQAPLHLEPIEQGYVVIILIDFPSDE
jgi:hypothetical protein